jgi:hypothetical protein
VAPVSGDDSPQPFVQFQERAVLAELFEDGAAAPAVGFEFPALEFFDEDAQGLRYGVEA